MAGLTLVDGDGEHSAVTDASSLAARIEGLLSARKLSKNALTLRCGLSSGYISKLTRTEGRGSRPVTMELLAAAHDSNYALTARRRRPRAAPAAPTTWGHSPREVAMRVYLARGLDPARIEAAASRVTARFGPGTTGEDRVMKTRDWVDQIG